MTTTPPIVTGAELAGFLGGAPNVALCELVAAAASEAVAAVVDPLDVDTDPDAVWPAHVRIGATGVAADSYKSLSAPGGGYQMDEVTVAEAFRVTSTMLRRYEPFLNVSRAVAGMIG